MSEELHSDQGTGYYCYCIAAAGASIDLKEVGCMAGGRPPYALRTGELQAIVSRVPTTEYGEESLRAMFQRMDWVERAVLSHEQVVEACLRQTEVVPMKFCTIFRSEGDLSAALGARGEELARRLLDLQGKQEWGLRLVADRERLRRHLLDSDPALRRLHQETASKSTGAAYLLKKRLQDRLGAAMEQARAVAAEDGYARLAAVSTRSALLKASGSPPGGGDPILNAAFLVTAPQLGALLDLAERLVSERPWLRGEPSGPWPPYNFV